MTNKNPKTRRLIIFILVFVVMGVLPWVLRYLILIYIPMPEQLCKEKCAAYSKNGHWVYYGPYTPKDTTFSEFRKCECY